MRFYFFIVLFFICFLGSSKKNYGQVKEQKEKDIDENNVELNKLDSNLSLTDSVYHAGALLFMEYNLDFNRLSSKFCLSCHDGVLVTGGHTSTNFGNPESVSKMAAITKFDHPVAFEYTRKLALSSRSLRDPGSFSPSLNGTIAEVLLVDGKVECVTCHNIFFKTEKRERHNILNESVGTLLCLECHIR